MLRESCHTQASLASGNCDPAFSRTALEALITAECPPALRIALLTCTSFLHRYHGQEVYAPFCYRVCPGAVFFPPFRPLMATTEDERLEIWRTDVRRLSLPSLRYQSFDNSLVYFSSWFRGDGGKTDVVRRKLYNCQQDEYRHTFGH